jgi:hypothetical protein
MKIVKIIIVCIVSLSLLNCNGYLNYQKASNYYNTNKYKRYNLDKAQVQAVVNKFVITYQLKTPYTYINIEPVENDFEVTIKTADNLMYAAMFDGNYKFLLYRQIME